MQLPDPQSTRVPAPAPYLRIATEEAFAPPEMLDIYRRILERGDAAIGPHCQHIGGSAKRADGREVPEGIIGRITVQAWIHHENGPSYEMRPCGFVE